MAEVLSQKDFSEGVFVVSKKEFAARHLNAKNSKQGRQMTSTVLLPACLYFAMSFADFSTCYPERLSNKQKTKQAKWSLLMLTLIWAQYALLLSKQFKQETIAQSDTNDHLWHHSNTHYSCHWQSPESLISFGSYPFPPYTCILLAIFTNVCDHLQTYYGRSFPFCSIKLHL